MTSAKKIPEMHPNNLENFEVINFKKGSDSGFENAQVIVLKKVEMTITSRKVLTKKAYIRKSPRD